MKKLILSCFLSALCLTTVYAVDDSGTCGENLNWSYDSSTKTLSITGQGDMSNYKFLSYSTGYTTPWWNYHMQIENISIANGVTSIGVYAFADCEKVANIILPNSVKKIGESAFYGCSALTTVYVGEDFSDLGDKAFYGCSALTSFTCAAYFPPTVRKAIHTGNTTDAIYKECWAFANTNQNLIIYVPCARLEVYENSDWSQLYTTLIWINNHGGMYEGYYEAELRGFGNCEGYTVTVQSSDISKGTVSGGGHYEEGETVTLTATPKGGYKFTRWSDGSTANPYTFTVTSDVSLTAYFESAHNPVSSAFWNMSDAAFNSLGTISSEITINGLTIYATSSKNVVVDESVQEIDGLTFTHRLKLNGTGASDARMLSFDVEEICDIDVYLKSGSGSEDRSLNVDKGSFDGTLKQIPAYSNAISKETIHYTGGTSTIYLYSPSGGVNIYAIRVRSMSTPQLQTYTVSVSSNNTSMGTVSGGGTYEEGATATVTASPKSGYKFTKWSNGNTTNPYSFTVTSNVSLTAYFEQSSTPQPESSTFWNMSDAAFNSLGTISSNKTINGLTIYATSSKNVVIDGSNQEIDGLSFTHRLKLNGTGSSDARLLSFHVDGKCDIDVYLKSGSGSEDRTLNIDKGSYGSSLTTIPALSASISKGTIYYTGGATTIYLYSSSGGVNIYAIRVTSENTPQPTTYTVSVSSANSSMGTVSGGGQYEEGATATITATPKSGYKFTRWSDGSTANPYSFTVTGNVSLTAYFEQSSTPEPASSKFWNISDGAFNSLGTITSTKTIDGLTIYATSSKNVVIDGSNQEIDGLSFTHRLKLNGTGSSDARLLSFHVDGKCDIDVYLKSGSGSEDRTLNIDKGSFGSALTTIPALSASISKGTIHYTGGATTIYLYSPSSGVNVYAIRVTTGGGSEDIENNTYYREERAQKILRNGQILIIRGDHTYTLQGQEVK